MNRYCFKLLSWGSSSHSSRKLKSKQGHVIPVQWPLLCREKAHFLLSLPTLGQGPAPMPLLLPVFCVGLQERHVHWDLRLIGRTQLGWRSLLHFLKYSKLERIQAFWSLNGSFTASTKIVLDVCSSCLPKKAPSSGRIHGFPVSHSRSQGRDHCGQELWWESTQPRPQATDLRSVNRPLTFMFSPPGKCFDLLGFSINTQPPPYSSSYLKFASNSYHREKRLKQHQGSADCQNFPSAGEHERWELWLQTDLDPSVGSSPKHLLAPSKPQFLHLQSGANSALLIVTMKTPSVGTCKILISICWHSLFQLINYPLV